MISFTCWLTSFVLPRYGKGGGRALEDDGPCPWMFVASWITKFPSIQKDLDRLDANGLASLKGLSLNIGHFMGDSWIFRWALPMA